MIRIGQKDFADLLDVGLGVGVDLFAGQNRPGFVAAGGIADAGGVIADDQDCLVSPFLELPDDPQRHRVAQRYIRRRRIHAQLDAQRLAGLGTSFQLCRRVLLAEDALAAAAKHPDLFIDRNHVAHAIPAEAPPLQHRRMAGQSLG